MTNLDDPIADVRAQRNVYTFIGIGAGAFLVFLLVMTLSAVLGPTSWSLIVLSIMTVLTGLFILSISLPFFQNWMQGQ